MTELPSPPLLLQMTLNAVQQLCSYLTMDEHALLRRLSPSANTLFGRPEFFYVIKLYGLCEPLASFPHTPRLHHLTIYKWHAAFSSPHLTWYHDWSQLRTLRLFACYSTDNTGKMSCQLWPRMPYLHRLYLGVYSAYTGLVSWLKQGHAPALRELSLTRKMFDREGLRQALATLVTQSLQCLTLEGDGAYVYPLVGTEDNISLRGVVVPGSKLRTLIFKYGAPVPAEAAFYQALAEQASDFEHLEISRWQHVEGLEPLRALGPQLTTLALHWRDFKSTPHSTHHITGLRHFHRLQTLSLRLSRGLCNPHVPRHGSWIDILSPHVAKHTLRSLTVISPERCNWEFSDWSVLEALESLSVTTEGEFSAARLVDCQQLRHLKFCGEHLLNQEALLTLRKFERLCVHHSPEVGSKYYIGREAVETYLKSL